MSGGPTGLYIHIPFCRAKCTYCDFNSFSHLERLHQPYVQALCAEIDRYARRRGSLDVDTIYLGGGTPTCLQPVLLAEILTVCRDRFQLRPDAEITIEANPGTVTADNATVLHAAGVSRLSLGAQSFLDDELRLLGRIHSATDTREAIHLARSAGFNNINLDLIYGLPHQTAANWRFTLECALDLQPEHLSLYALSIEEGTTLARSIQRRELSSPDPDLAAEMYTIAEQGLAQQGYEHYELSNWAQRRPRTRDRGTLPSASPDCTTARCRHNLKYWQREPYLGFGAGAHSFYDEWRYHNLLEPQAYIARLQQGQDPVASQEWIGPTEAMGEAMILGLRLMDGVSFSDFQRQHKQDIHQYYSSELDDLQSLGLLAADLRGVRLTPRGRLLANQVFGRFWPGPAPKTH